MPAKAKAASPILVAFGFPYDRSSLMKLVIQPKANGPNLLRFQRSLPAKQATCVPRAPFLRARIIFRSSHTLLLAAEMVASYNEWRVKLGGVAAVGRSLRHKRSVLKFAFRRH